MSEDPQRHKKLLEENKQVEEELRGAVQELRKTTSSAADQLRREALLREYRLRRRV